MSRLQELHDSLTDEQKILHTEFVHEFAEVIKERNDLLQKLEHASYDARLMKKRLFGSSSEKVKVDFPLQGLIDLFNEFEVVSQEVEPCENPPD